MLNININKNLAQGIVNAVSSVVDKDINFISQNGIIIGSTDLKRINLFHEAGYEAIKRGTYIEVEKDDEYTGSKKGINYPIKIDDLSIGAIGITGDPLQVGKYGFLATKITEIFIKEQMLNYKYEKDREKINYVMKSLIYNQIENREDIERILKEFNISKDQELSVAVIKINKQNTDNKDNNVDFIRNEIEQFFYKIGVNFNMYVYPNKVIALVNKSQIDYIKDELKSLKHSINCGLGRLFCINDIHNSYEEALVALTYAQKHKKYISDIYDLNLEMILSSVDKNLKNHYTTKILSKLNTEELDLLKDYYENNASLKLTAEKLFVHKNTLQYRLERIYSKTNLNPRKFKDSVIFYIAMQFEN